MLSIYRGNSLIGILIADSIFNNIALSPKLDILLILSNDLNNVFTNSYYFWKLDALNFSLEKTVQERTYQLQKQNQELENTLIELKKVQKQVIVQEKMASLGELMAGIAHEIKNPLNFINNFSELTIDLSSELMEYLLKAQLNADALDSITEILSSISQNMLKINQHGKRADSIVKSMLLHSRGKSGEIISTDINNLLEEYLNLSYHGMRAKDSSFNIKIIKDYDIEIKKINIVPQDIGRVFLNIINNAFYSAHRKKKDLKGAFSPEVKLISKNYNNKIEIRITDNGYGLSQEVRNKVFTPFFTTKPPGEGTGLGLSISYDIIVNEHNGELKIESEEGKFAEFIIIIPKF